MMNLNLSIKALTAKVTMRLSLGLKALAVNLSFGLSAVVAQI